MSPPTGIPCSGLGVLETEEGEKEMKEGEEGENMEKTNETRNRKQTDKTDTTDKMWQGEHRRASPWVGTILKSQPFCYCI